jgi:hypothetical protein
MNSKTARILVILAAFLIVVSSALLLYPRPGDYPVYLNIAAMLALATAVSIKKKR